MSKLDNAPLETREAFEALMEYLLQNTTDSKKASGGTEVVKRCHYCGDSRDHNSRHLYIGIDNNGLIVHHCFKCNSGGLITSKFFRDLGIYDVDLINMVLRANSITSKSIPTAGVIKAHKPIFRAPNIICSDDDRSMKKLSYLNRRLGLYFSPDNLSQYKIILNIKDYISANEIGYFSRYPTIIDELDLGFLGFLSCDNSHIIMRRLVPENKVHPSLSERYTIYNIYPNYTDTLSYYIIPGQINSLRPCTIYLAEGPFDILSVYHNCNVDHTNAIFAAACGKTKYINLMNYILTQIKVPYFGLTVHLYADNDMTVNDIRSLKSYMSSLSITCIMHLNQSPGEKDFGVSADKIIDQSMNLMSVKSSFK